MREGIQRLMDQGLIQILKNKDENVVNMVGECSKRRYVSDVRFISGSLPMIHDTFVREDLIDFSHDDCPTCNKSTRGCAAA